MSPVGSYPQLGGYPIVGIATCSVPTDGEQNDSLVRGEADEQTPVLYLYDTDSWPRLLATQSVVGSSTSGAHEVPDRVGDRPPKMRGNCLRLVLHLLRTLDSEPRRGHRYS